MNRRKLLWQILPYYLLIIVGALVVTGLYETHEMRALYLDEVTRELEARARIVGEILVDSSTPFMADSVNERCRKLGRLSDTRITVVSPQGVVLADSEHDPLAMENHGSRPEIVQALDGRAGVETRFSSTLQRTMIYVAVPVLQEGIMVAVVRTSRPATAVGQALGALYGRLLMVGLVVAAVAALVSIAVFRRQAQSLQSLQRGAERFAAGDLDTKLAVPNTEEIGKLAEAMNDMAVQLHSRMETIAQQRNEREAIFAGMSEGVIALDSDDRIVLFNRAAGELLGITGEATFGRLLVEAVRVPVLHDLVWQAVSGTGIAEAEFTVPDSGGKHIQARAAAIAAEAGSHGGVVLVLSDISRLKQLETVRRDFVANVSHELKTPIAAIRGSVETLLEGAIDSAEDNRRFVAMIDKQSARLGALLDDLLSLARIEDQTSRHEARFTLSLMKDVIEAALQVCEEKAHAGNISVEYSCNPDLHAELDRPLMEQAVINLVDNAVRYSDRDTTVTIQVTEEFGQIRISVHDQGCGIESRHLSRLFERFYRVDTARSRTTGGTGLGLAIVKHVALLHGGTVDVTSAPGKGSTFSILFPQHRVQGGVR